LEDKRASLEKQSQQLQTEIDTLKQNLEDREIAVEALERKNSQSELEMERARASTQKLRENVETVGKCLKGTVGLILAARREDYGQMRTLLGAMEEPCNKSGSILDNLEKSGSEGRKMTMY
jgi:chromosome segregation ATPase